MPSDKGGLGIRNSYDFNQALLTKQVWKLYSDPNSLYSRVMIHKYTVELIVTSLSALLMLLLVGKVCTGPLSR